MVGYVISGETWLHNFGGNYDSYPTAIYYEQIATGDTTEGRLGLRFGTWYIVKLY